MPKNKGEKDREKGHSKARPSSKEKHTAAMATRKQQAENPDYKAFKKNGGKSAKTTWAKKGKPTKPTKECP